MYYSNRDGVPRSGVLVDSLLTKIEDLDIATSDKTGLLSNIDKVKLDSLEDNESLSFMDINRICV